MKGGDEMDLLLTPAQIKILQAIQEHPDKNQKQIGEIVGISQARVSKHLQQIRKNNPENEELERTIRTYDKRTSYRFYKFKSNIN